MGKQRPFRFGTAAYRATSRAELIDLAHKIEDLGYSVCANADQFGAGMLPPLMTLMTVAEHTSKLRVAATVFANDFHHPAVLAREAATLDLLSTGRFEFGIGASYQDAVYEMTGVPFDPPGVRVSRLAEAVQIIKGLFADGPVTFAGKYYAVYSLEGYPKPFQRPRPPIMIGGGSKRILSLAAKEADIVGLFIPSRAGAFDLSRIATAEQQIGWIRAAAGPRFDELEINALIAAVVVTDYRRMAAERLAHDLNVTPAAILASTHFLVGTIDQICADIQSRRERYGISYTLVLPEHMDDFAPVVARLAGK